MVYVVAMAEAEDTYIVVVDGVSSDIVKIPADFDAVGVVFDSVEADVAENACVIYASEVI